MRGVEGAWVEFGMVTLLMGIYSSYPGDGGINLDDEEKFRIRISKDRSCTEGGPQFIEC